MSCPLYQDSTSENPLRVCGPRDRMGYAPSFAHVRLFCLTVSAFQECPNYKLKMKNWKEINWWDRFLNRFRILFTRKKGEKRWSS